MISRRDITELLERLGFVCYRYDEKFYHYINYQTKQAASVSRDEKIGDAVASRMLTKVLDQDLFQAFITEHRSD